MAVDVAVRVVRTVGVLLIQVHADRTTLTAATRRDESLSACRASICATAAAGVVEVEVTIANVVGASARLACRASSCLFLSGCPRPSTVCVVEIKEVLVDLAVVVIVSVLAAMVIVEAASVVLHVSVSIWVSISP